MAFAIELQDFLQDRTARLPSEYAAGESLEDVLNRHLAAVESTADTGLLTSVLVLDPDRKRLWHAAAPSLPRQYRDAIDGGEIGASAGSCGTAAFKGHAIYVSDIATDPLWCDYRHAALPHGLRACWSTPIYDKGGSLIGTFAIYHLTPRSPTREEVDAIGLITTHVANAIEWFRDAQDLEPNGQLDVARASPGPTLEQKNNSDRATAEVRGILRSIEAKFEKLAKTIERAIETFPDSDTNRLNRAKQAARRGAEIAGQSIESD